MIDYHRQCKLIHLDSHAKMISWIPDQFACVGNLVKLKNNGKWEENWVIEEIFDKLPTDTVMKRKDDYKKQRRASDI